MARLCGDLLSLVRSERALEVKRERFDINAVCRQVLATAATSYLEKGLEFEGPGEGHLMMEGDPYRTEDVVLILVDNACKYTPSGGRVTVSTQRQGGRVLVKVSDTGVGIAEEDLPNIFERFYRSDISRSKETGGFGLGLPIAKRVVEALGGTMAVESRVGQGSTFTVTLPKGR